MTQKSGFVAVLGEPNVGKSTLINQLVGTKVSIVSPKVQTTRQRILGIVMKDESQIILIDTPGIFQPKKRLDRAMVSAAWDAGKDADVVALLIDVSKKNQAGSKEILKSLENHKVILVMNKIDTIDKPRLLALAAEYGEHAQVEQIFMVSALTGNGVPDLLDFFASRMGEGPYLFPEDQISDLPQRMWAAEITREQLYHQLYQELPYDTYVESEAWEEFDNGSVKIHQVIYVNREGQKLIILGKKGAQIKAISQAARTELSALLERPVHLFLHVKVAENWAEKTAAYRLMGLDFGK